jgi:gamma-glutamyltranspeptidase / glutathione hydrolase
MITRILISSLVFAFFIHCKTRIASESNIEDLNDSGMVVSAHPEASKIGLEILKKGGNAVDAAVATGFALAVCYPSAGNIGGGGFMVIRLNDGSSFSLDYREKAPGFATKDMFLDKSGKVVNDMSLYSHAASGVPGSVDGLITAHEKYGKLSFKEVIQPAIDLAQNGFALTKRQSEDLNHQKEMFLNLNHSKIPFVKESEQWKAGDTLKQPDLAHSLQLIKDKGRDGFYKGEIAMKIITEMKQGKGFISQQDLDNYHSVWREPIVGSYKGYKIISMPPPSSGGIALLQLLKIIENYPIQDWMGNKEQLIHLMIEAERRVYADRSEHLGDADFYNVPVKGLIDSIYLLGRMQDFNPEKASSSKIIKPGKPSGYESEETTHYSVTDCFGNAVSVTTTLNGSHGSPNVVVCAGCHLY